MAADTPAPRRVCVCVCVCAGQSLTYAPGPEHHNAVSAFRGGQFRHFWHFLLGLNPGPGAHPWGPGARRPREARGPPHTPGTAVLVKPGVCPPPLPAGVTVTGLGKL